MPSGLASAPTRRASFTWRAVVVYVAALVMVRVGEKRFLSKSTAFDVILGTILGSVVSPAITGSSLGIPTLVSTRSARTRSGSLRAGITLQEPTLEPEAS